MDQLQRDVLDLLHFSLRHEAPAARIFFRMFTPEQIGALYAIPLRARERIWANRSHPEYRSLFEPPNEPPLPPRTG